MAMRATEQLPADVEALKAIIAHERTTHVLALEEIERLRAQMRLLLAQRFGAKRERGRRQWPVWSVQRSRDRR